ncbi:hypothetical protein PG994_003467 [Apiospora phragmitis]|uniref:Uncharacterized protein n=1 Tax=Apiospora phragmitis TaxID=2905665 RepID=A0ABR1VY74_9PEZI
MSYSLIGLSLIALLALTMAWREWYPTPYPGIPYNKESAHRITGDIPDLVSVIQRTNESSDAIFTITTQKLGTPVVQLLFLGLRKPLIVLEDPQEIEDIVLRRNKEFDKATMAKRLWADVISADFLYKTAAPNIYKATLELLDLWRLKLTTTYKGEPLLIQFVNQLDGAC